MSPNEHSRRPGPFGPAEALLPDGQEPPTVHEDRSTPPGPMPLAPGEPLPDLARPTPGPLADEQGNFLPLPEWKPGQPEPPNWPRHIHPPKEHGR